MCPHLVRMPRLLEDPTDLKSEKRCEQGMGKGIDVWSNKYRVRLKDMQRDETSAMTPSR